MNERERNRLRINDAASVLALLLLAGAKLF
jgi:hypothetical protein